MESNTQQSGIKTPTLSERTLAFLQELVKNRNALAGLLIIVPVTVLTIFAPLVISQDPTATDPANAFAGPSTNAIMGTDHLGRDLFSRVVLGGRVSLFLGLSAVVLALSLGIPIGLAAGYKGGRFDEFIMRLMDVVMSFPTLILALMLLVALSSSLLNAILAVGVVYAPRLARVVRASTMSIKNEEFVKAAQVRGESDWYIMLREILPNILGPIAVEGSIRIGYAIIIGTSLSFLGLGAQPPTPDWGYMIATSQDYVYSTPWFLLWPSLMLGLTVLGFNLLGDGLSDMVDTEVEGDT